MTLSTVCENLKTVEAVLNYLAPAAERPRSYAYDPPPNVPRTTAVNVPFHVPVHDGRPIANELTLDRNGFALVGHRSAVRNFYDDDEVRNVYYQEAKHLLKRLTGASRVFIFDHTTRRRIPGAEDRRDGVRQPVSRVHVDHTAKSGPQRVRDLIPDEASELLRGRVQVINLWRPIRGPLLDAPLAVCDAGSVDPEDLIPSDLIYRERIGETYSVSYRPSHRWYYFFRNASGRGAAPKVLRLGNRWSRSFRAAQRICRSNDTGGCTAAGEHRTQNARVPSGSTAECECIKPLTAGNR